MAHAGGFAAACVAQNCLQPAGEFVIAQAVEDILTLFFVHNHAGVAQDAQLLGDVGLGFPQQGLQVSDAFSIPAQCIEDAQPLGMSKELDAVAQINVV